MDFFTYSCVNCRRTLPYLKDWWAKYKDCGLLIIGIHTPEFEFEKNSGNVETALMDLGVTWPVLLDNDYINWRAFANRYWPAKYLFNQGGELIYTHFGEGEYRKTEETIRQLLNSGSSSAGAATETSEHEHGEVCFIPTPETYCGFARGRLFEQNYNPNSVFDYWAPTHLPQDGLALKGSFLAKEEFVESRAPGASILINFQGTEVNLVLSAASNTTKIALKLDEKNLNQNALGRDVNLEGEVEVKKPRMYNLIKSNTPLNGVLKVEAVEGNFRAYAFTFSGCS